MCMYYWVILGVNRLWIHIRKDNIMISLQELVNHIEGRHIFIQTHNFPDPDAISSAYGLKKLLEIYDISSTICYKGRIDRYAMKQFIEYLGVEVVNMDNLVYMTDSDEIILVDGQKGNANLVDLIGNEVICIDHHPICEFYNYRYSDIRPEIGACASIIASYFFENDIEIDKKTATALLYGIKVDTANLTRGVNTLDLDMFYKLFWKADRDVLGKIERSGIQFDDLKAYANAISSIKIFDNISIAHTGEDCPEALIASISDFMLELSEIDCSIVYSIRKDGIKLSIRSCDSDIDSGWLADEALRGIGTGGGHATMAGGFVPYPADMKNLDIFVQMIENRFMDVITKEK